MNTPASRSKLIAGIGWVATAALAFSFGRLTSPSETQPGKSDKPAASSAAGAPAGTETMSAEEVATLRKGQFASEDRPTTIDGLTHGQPLDKWLKKLLSQEDSIVRMTGMVSLLELLNDPADLKAALEAINLRGDRGFGRGARFTEYSMVLEKWAQLDPKGAIAFTEGKSREERWLGTSTVLRTWTRTDPAAAIAWAKAAGADAGVAGDQNGDRGGFGERGPSALSTVISQLAHSDLDRALTVAAGEKFDGRSRAVDTIASELLAQRGPDAARKLVDDMPAGSLRDGLVSQIAGPLAAKDGPGTAAWVLSMPASDGRSRALAETIDEWSKKDATAAGTFLAKLPPSPEFDRSRQEYADNVARTDPAGAMAWATAITEEERRLRTVAEVAQTWKRQDEPGLQAWVAQSPLSDAQKQRILAPRPPGGFGGPGFGPGGPGPR